MFTLKGYLVIPPNFDATPGHQIGGSFALTPWAACVFPFMVTTMEDMSKGYPAEFKHRSLCKPITEYKMITVTVWKGHTNPLQHELYETDDGTITGEVPMEDAVKMTTGIFTDSRGAVYHLDKGILLGEFSDEGGDAEPCEPCELCEPCEPCDTGKLTENDEEGEGDDEEGEDEVGKDEVEEEHEKQREVFWKLAIVPAIWIGMGWAAIIGMAWALK